MFGAVTGALTVIEVTARVGSGIFKLKQIWDEVKQVPQIITTLIDEIDMLNPLLAELEADMNLGQSHCATYGDPSAKRSVEFCRRTLDEMAAVTVDLTARVSSTKRARRGIAKGNVVLKKDVLLNFEDHLRRVVSMLGLAQQYYMM